MLHSYRDVFQTLPAYRRGNGSPPITPDVDRSTDFLGGPGSHRRPKLKSQVAQTIKTRSDYDKETSLLPLVWVEVRDNVIPPHAVPFASDGHGPLFIARAHIEGTFFLGKAGPQFTSGAIISYGSLDITVTRYDVLVCAGQLSWDIPHSSGTGLMRQDTVVTRYDINYDPEPALMYRQDIPENAYDLADVYNRVGNNQCSTTLDADADPAIVALHNRTRSLARSNSRYGLTSNESLDVDVGKAYDNFVPLRSPLELTERSRSLPPRARASTESSFDARAELGAFRCDSAQSAGVTAIITSATHRPEYAPVSRPRAATSSKPRVRLDCASQESYRFPTVASAVEHSASERGTPVGSFGRSEFTGLREVANVDGWSDYSSPAPEPPAQSMHAGFVQDVLPLRRDQNTGITTSTSVNHHTDQSSASVTSDSLESNVINHRITKFSNPSPKNDSQLTPMHYPFSSHKMPSDSSLPQPAIGFSHGTWVGTPGSSVSCLCTFDVVKDTRSKSQSNLANCPVHPAADKTDIFASSDDFLHANQYDQWAYPVAQTHVLQGGAQHQKYQSRDSPSRIPQPPTFPSVALPPAQSSLADDHADVDLRSTEYSRHSMPGGPIETFPEDGNMITSEHMCGSDHWQLVSRTTFGIEAQTCDGAESDTVASELPAPISINPLNAGIVTDEVKPQPHPVPHITSVSQIAGNGGRGRTRVAMQESTLERKPIQENRVAVTASSQTTSTEKFTPVVPCRETLVTEECVPLSTVTYTPSLPPSRRQSSQTFSYSNDSGTDDKLHRHREYADSSVLACASVAPGENNNSTPTRSIVIAVDNTQKPSSASNDLRNPSFVKSTLTIGESHPLAADRHGELCGQDVVRDRPSQVSPTPKLEDEEENVSTYRKRQTVEGREDYERGTEREVKPNLTSYSRTVRISQGYTPESAISNDDRRMNGGADGAALSLSSISPGFKQSSFSEPGIQQDLGTNRIQTECEHRTSDVDTVSKSSVQISSHHSTESSEGHTQRQGREEVDSSVLVRVSLAPVENNAAPVPAPRRAVENTQKPSPASNDLQNSSLLEDTWTMGQTSSSVTSLKGSSCGQIAGRDLPTQSPTPNVEHDKVPVSAACIHQDPEDSKNYHAQETESDVTLKLKSYPSAVRSLRQSESATVLNAGGRTDEDTDSVISSLSSTNSGCKLSPSEPGVPQDARTNHIQSACEHQSSEINVVSTTLVQTSSHHSIENRSQSSSRITIQGGPCGQDTGIDVLQVLESNTTPPQSLDVAVENTETSSPAPDDLRNSPSPEGTSTIGQTSPSGANLQEARGHDVGRDRHSSRGSSITKFEDNRVDVSAGTVHQALVTRGDYHERETESKVERNLTYHSCTVEILGQSSTSDTVTGSNDRQMDKDADTALPLPPATTRPKLSNSEPDIPQDAATTRVQSECMTQSSNVITVSTTSMQTSSHSSTVSSEDIRQQPALASSYSKEPAIDDKVNKATTPVHQLLAPGEHNSTLVQPIDVAAENTQQPGPASNDIRNSSLPDGVSTTGQTSPSAYHVCGEPCGPDVTRDPPNQGSSSPKLQDDKEKISADHTCQVTEGTRNYKSDTTDEREKKSQVEVSLTHDFRLVTIPSQTVTEPVMSNDDRRMNEDAGGAVLISPSPNPESKGSPSEPSVPQDAATDHVQSGCEHHYTKDITVSVMSVRVSSNCLTDSSKGCACLDNPSQQSNNHPDTISVLPMPGGPYLPPPVCYEVHDFGNCSCVSPVIASAEGDSTTVVASGVVEKRNSVSNAEAHPAPCAEGAASVKSRQDDCMHSDPAVISPTHAVDQRCNSSTVQTPCQTENQDNTSCAADKRPCCTQEPADVIVSALSVSDACGTLTPNDCPPVDDQSTHNAASDCACVPPV